MRAELIAATLVLLVTALLVKTAMEYGIRTTNWTLRDGIGVETEERFDMVRGRKAA